MFAGLYSEKGSLGFQPQKLKDTMTGANKNRTLCLVSDTRAKMSPTADQAARWFAADGWKVTLLDLSPEAFSAENTAPYSYERLSGKFRETNWYTPMQSLCAYQWLKDKAFDAITFQHGFGAAYFACAAKRMTLAFDRTAILLIPDDPYAYWLESARRFPTNVRIEAEIDHMERMSVERADGLLFTNAAALEWMINARWELGNDAAGVAILNEDEGSTSWGEWIAGKISAPPLKPMLDASEIRISVCISTCDRPKLLRETLNDLLKQTLQNFEVIIVDSSKSGVNDELREEFDRLFKSRGWQWVTQDRLGLGAARNYGASLAHGTHLLFMDDDNIALADEIETFARAARSGVDIITCILGRHPQQPPYPASAHFPSRSKIGDIALDCECIYNGADLTNGIFFNACGDANALIRKSVFDALGGRAKERTFEDWEFYVRAKLAGYKIETIPEILYLYLVNPEGGSKEQGIMFGQLLFIIRAYASSLPAYMYPWLLSIISHLDKDKRETLTRFPDPSLSSAFAENKEPHRAFRS